MRKTFSKQFIVAGDYIGINGSFFDDNQPRGFEVKSNEKDELYIEYSDDEKQLLSELPEHIITVLDKRNFEVGGIFL